MDRPSYFLHIDRIKDDPCLIEKEKHRLDSVISKISSEIKSAITPRTAPGLIWALAWEEIGRVLDTIQHLPETRLSDFCGHARYLRGVAASVPFQSAELSEDPRTQELLNRCDALWQVVLHREMIETLNYKATKNRTKRDIGPFAPLNRLPEVFSDSRQVQRLTRHRDPVLEEDAQSLLAEVVKPQITVPNYYLPVGKDGVLAERDLLLLRDGTALIVECKAKPLRPIAEHRGNICKIESDVKRAIQQGYDQACSVHSYLFSQDDCIVLWDSDKQDKKELARVNRHDVRDALVIVVLDSYYGLIATDLAPWLQVNEGIGFPWVVDRDTLESILRVMSSFEQLVAFLRWRRNLHGVAVNEDEAVFAGFFLRHGPADVPRNAALVQLDASYADVFEADYFRRKGAPIDLPKEVGPPVWSSMQRDGDTITYKIDDEFYDAVDLKTGRSIRESAESQARTYRSELESSTLQGKHQPHTKPRRNGPCPCGSGQKYKKRCLRRG